MNSACCKIGIATAVALCELAATLHPPTSFSEAFAKGPSSPFLFLLVMDPQLRQLQSHSLGISENNTYAGGYLHTDDIRTLANSQSVMESQIEMVFRFTSVKFLTLNESKCEVIIYKKSSKLPSPVSITNGDTSECSFPVKEEAKCLGYVNVKARL